MVKEVNGGEGARRDDERGVGERSSVKNTREKDLHKKRYLQETLQPRRFQH